MLLRCTAKYHLTRSTFHSTARLSLGDNSLMGTIPSQLGLLTKLSESSVVWLLVVTGTIPSEVGLLTKLGKSSVVWLLVVMIVLSCVFSLYSHACLSYSFYRLLASP